MTREWWSTAPERFDLVASALVVAEARAGDPDAARSRLNALGAAVLLDATPEAEELTRTLLDLGAFPYQAAEDAAHIANAAMRTRIERTCREAGYEPPVICTPSELLGNDDGYNPT